MASSNEISSKDLFGAEVPSWHQVEQTRDMWCQPIQIHVLSNEEVVLLLTSLFRMLISLFKWGWHIIFVIFPFLFPFFYPSLLLGDVFVFFFLSSIRIHYLGIVEGDLLETILVLVNCDVRLLFVNLLLWCFFLLFINARLILLRDTTFLAAQPFELILQL